MSCSAPSPGRCSEGDGAVAPCVTEDGFAAEERLRIYRNGCRSTLVETLRMSYPAVERLVGIDFFGLAAGRYVDQHPARSGYLNDYGGEFSAFLERFEPARSLAYLPDVARFEWALSVAANAADAPVLELAALVGIDESGHGELRFEPHPSVSLLRLAYPADEIADTVLAADEAAMAEVDLAGGPVRLVVHRGPEGLQTERLGERAFAFLALLFAGEPLERLAAAAEEDAPMLLAQQLAKGRLSACRTQR